MEVEIVRMSARGSAAELIESGWAARDIYALTGQELSERAHANGVSAADRAHDAQLVQLCRAVLRRGRFGPLVRAALLACYGAGTEGILPGDLARSIGVPESELGTRVFAGFGNAISATPAVKQAFADGLSEETYRASRLFFTFPVDAHGHWRYLLRPEAREALRAEEFVSN